MTAERHKGRYVYYRCVANTTSARLCAAPYVHADVAEPAVLALLGRLRVPDALKRSILEEAAAAVEEGARKGRSAADSLRARRSKLEAQEGRLTEAFAAGDVSLAAYRATAGKVRARLAALDRAAEAGRAAPELVLARLDRLLAQADSLLPLHARCSPRARTALLRIVFKRVTVTSAGAVAYQLNAPFDSMLREANAPEGPMVPAGDGGGDGVEALTATLTDDASPAARLRALDDSLAA